MGFDYTVPPRHEQVIAVASLKATGELPDNPYWNRLEDRYEKNPLAFDRYHPLLSPLLKRDSPESDVLPDTKEYKLWHSRLDKNEKNFKLYHPGWMVRLINLDDWKDKGNNGHPPGQHPNPPKPPKPPKHPKPPIDVDCEPKPPCQSTAVPEPGTALLLSVGLIGGLLKKRLTG